MSVFYDHLLGLDELHQELLGYNLDVKEHYYLLSLADSALHHEVMAVCLDCLPKEEHESFLVSFESQPSAPSLLILLKDKDPFIEEKIKAKSTEVKEKIKNDLKKVKKA